MFLVDNTWSLPNSAVGALFSTLNIWNEIDTDPKRQGKGQLYYKTQWFSPFDTTFGNVTVGLVVPVHELVHGFQARLFGPAVLPARHRGVRGQHRPAVLGLVPRLQEIPDQECRQLLRARRIRAPLDRGVGLRRRPGVGSELTTKAVRPSRRRRGASDDGRTPCLIATSPRAWKAPTSSISRESWSASASPSPASRDGSGPRPRARSGGSRSSISCRSTGVLDDRSKAVIDAVVGVPPVVDHVPPIVVDHVPPIVVDTRRRRRPRPSSRAPSASKAGCRIRSHASVPSTARSARRRRSPTARPTATASTASPTTARHRQGRPADGRISSSRCSMPAARRSPRRTSDSTRPETSSSTSPCRPLPASSPRSSIASRAPSSAPCRGCPRSIWPRPTSPTSPAGPGSTPALSPRTPRPPSLPMRRASSPRSTTACCGATFPNSLPSLLIQGADLHPEAIETAIARNIVPTGTEPDARATLRKADDRALLDAPANHADAPVLGGSSVRSSSRETSANRSSRPISTSTGRRNGSGSRSRRRARLDEKAADRLQFAFQATLLADGHQPLVDRLLAEHASGDVGSVRDLAGDRGTRVGRADQGDRRPAGLRRSRPNGGPARGLDGADARGRLPDRRPGRKGPAARGQPPPRRPSPRVSRRQPDVRPGRAQARRTCRGGDAAAGRGRGRGRDSSRRRPAAVQARAAVLDDRHIDARWHHLGERHRPDGQGNIRPELRGEDRPRQRAPLCTRRPITSRHSPSPCTPVTAPA